MKKKIIGLFTLIMLIAMNFNVVIYAEQAGGNPADIVVVIDDTGSMKDNDPQHLAEQAINQIADQFLPNDNIRFGVALYDLDIRNGALPLGTYTKDDLKAFGSTISQDGKGTDAAIGLDWAVNELNTKKRDGASQAIIIVGDGWNSFVRDNVARRTDAESDQMRDAAIQTAKTNGYKVYSLAINPTEERYKNYFENLASQTGGIFKMPTSDTISSDIREIMNNITGTKIGPSGEKVMQKDEKIESEYEVPDNAYQLNVRVDHKDAIDITLVRPDGSTVQSNGTENIYVNNNGYSNFKVIKPEKGKWKIILTNLSEAPQPIKWEITSMDQMGINCFAKNGADGKIILSTNLVIGGSNVTDMAVLKQVTCKAKVTEDGGASDIHDMPLNNTSFETTLDLDKSKQYEVKVTLDFLGSKFEQILKYPEDFDKLGVGPNSSSSSSSTPGSTDSDVNIGLILSIAGAVLALIVILLVIINILKKRKANQLIQFKPDVSIKLSCESEYGRDIFEEKTYTNIGTILLSPNSSTLDLILRNYKASLTSVIGGMASGRDKLQRAFTDEFFDAVSKIRLCENRGGREWMAFENPAINELGLGVKFSVNENTIEKYPAEISIITDNLYVIEIDMGDEKKYMLEIIFRKMGNSMF